MANGTQVTVTDVTQGGYPTSPGFDTLTNNNPQSFSPGNFFTDFSLTHQDVLLDSLSFTVTTAAGFDGSGRFDPQGNFVFTPAGPNSQIPTSATLYSNGLLGIDWTGNPGTTTITADYTAANALLELFQNTTTSSTPVYVKSYAIDPVTNSASDPIQAAMPAELMNSQNGVAGLVQGKFGNGGGGHSTIYSLAQAQVDPATVKLTLYQDQTELGTGYFTSASNFVFTPMGSPAMVPTSGAFIGSGQIALTWSQTPPTNTSINVTYFAGDNRIFNVSLAHDTVSNGIPGSYVAELVATSTFDPMLTPSFSQVDQYNAPTAQFVFPPTVDANGVLSGSLGVDVFTPMAQQFGDTSATISLYYNTTGDLKAGTLIETFPYSNLENGNANGARTLSFKWKGFADLPAGNYYVYAEVNDGMNQPVYSAVQGPYSTTGATPTLGGATLLILTPGANGALQGVFSSATNNALTVGPNYTAPVTVNLTVNGGGSLILPGTTTPVQTYSQTFANDAAANAALDGLQFVADSTFHVGTTLTYSASVTVPMTVNNTVQQVTLMSTETIPVVTTNTHLVVTQSVDTTTPTDPTQAIITITVTNPGGPDGQDGTNVQVQSKLTAGLTVLSSSASTGTYDPTTGLWTIGNLPLTGANSATLTVTVQAAANTANTPLSSSATASSALPNFPVSDAQSLVPVLPQANAIVITPATLPDPVIGAPYQVQYTANGGGGGPYTFNTNPAPGFSPLPLPTGLTLQPQRPAVRHGHRIVPRRGIPTLPRPTRMAGAPRCCTRSRWATARWASSACRTRWCSARPPIRISRSASIPCRRACLSCNPATTKSWPARRRRRDCIRSFSFSPLPTARRITSITTCSSMRPWSPAPRPCPPPWPAAPTARRSPPPAATATSPSRSPAARCRRA